MRISVGPKVFAHANACAGEPDKPGLELPDSWTGRLS
jgi:hypothetical protein